MQRLLSSKAQGCKDFWKASKPCHVGIHWMALTEYSQMSTHLPGLWSFFRFFAPFCIGLSSHQQRYGLKVQPISLPVLLQGCPRVFILEQRQSILHVAQHFIGRHETKSAINHQLSLPYTKLYIYIKKAMINKLPIQLMEYACSKKSVSK